MQNLGGNRVYYYGGFENSDWANPCLRFFASSSARGSSCVVSGFGQVLKSDPPVSSAFGRTRIVPPRRTREKNIWYPGYIGLSLPDENKISQY